MDMLVFGHGGARVLVFPTSMGRYYEWEDRGMMGALGEHIERGWIQVFCVDSVDEESWYARWKDPGARAWRHLEYENYLLHEVLPLMSSKNPTPYLITTGASFGAYHAMNFALRHLHPKRPVVRPALPLAQGVANPLTPQRAREPTVVANIGVLAANCHNNIKLTQQVEARLIRFVWDIKTGTIVIEIIVTIITSPALDIIQSAHGDHTVGEIGMP